MYVYAKCCIESFCVFVHLNVCMYVYIHVCVCFCVFVHVKSMYECMYTYMYVCASVYFCMYMLCVSFRFTSSAHNKYTHAYMHIYKATSQQCMSAGNCHLSSFKLTSKHTHTCTHAYIQHTHKHRYTGNNLSTVHVREQPSPSLKLESSHCSFD